MASIIARRNEMVPSIARELGLSREEAITTILLYILNILRKFSLKYVSMDNHARLPLIGRVYKPIATAIELSSRIKLRTLDLLHVAYAKLLKDRGGPIQRFVTIERFQESTKDT